MTLGQLQGPTVRLPRVILAAENSRGLREQLNAELRVFTDTEALTAWAGKILPQKLTTSDAEAVEIAFVAKLTKLGVANENIAFEISNAATARSGSPEVRHRSALPGLRSVRIYLRLKAGADFLQRNADCTRSPPPRVEERRSQRGLYGSCCYQDRLGN